MSDSKIEFKSDGLCFKHDLTFEEWKELGNCLRKVEKGIQFWLGDWLNYGERKWGEMYSQALEETDYKEQTLMNFKYVADKVQFSRRRENLSWSHHEEVASLEPERQDKWLDIAKTENSSGVQMKKRTAYVFIGLYETFMIE